MLARILKQFKIGKYAFFRGYDIQGNRYFERPNPQSFDPLNPRFTKRSIEYKQAKPLYAYTGTDIAPQWQSWLRHSRLEPPTLEELYAEEQRYTNLQQNVATLNAEQAAIKLAASEANARLTAPRTRPDEAADPANVAREEELETPAVKEVHTIKTKTQDGRRMKEEELQREWIRKRQELAKSPLAAFRPPSNPDDNYQPESWTPTPRR